MNEAFKMRTAMDSYDLNNLDKDSLSSFMCSMAMQANTTNSRITEHKRELNDRIDKVIASVDNGFLKVNNVLKEMQEYSHKMHLELVERINHIEKSQIKENGKIWAKIGTMGAAIGGLLYVIGHWLKKAF